MLHDPLGTTVRVSNLLRRVVQFTTARSASAKTLGGSVAAVWGHRLDTSSSASGQPHACHHRFPVENQGRTYPILIILHV
jgi:hypothetical protein